MVVALLARTVIALLLPAPVVSGRQIGTIAAEVI
jgi:hypothetical protein